MTDKELLDKTWTDFTKRMKGSQVTQENWALFYEKYYGFIVCYIKKHSNLKDVQIQAVVDMVVDDIFIKHKLDNFETRKDKSFRSWFAALIHRRMIDYYRSIKNDPVLLGEDHYASVKDPESEKEGIGDEELWQSYMAYLVYDEVSKKADANQVHCFVWRVYNKRKPSEIAAVLRIEPERVYEEVRAFKDKISNTAKKFGENYDIKTTDWEALKRKADEAKARYQQVADDFSLRVRKS